MLALPLLPPLPLPPLLLSIPGPDCSLPRELQSAEAAVGAAGTLEPPDGGERPPPLQLLLPPYSPPWPLR
jgi:hypothetical protein